MTEALGTCKACGAAMRGGVRFCEACWWSSSSGYSSSALEHPLMASPNPRSFLQPTRERLLRVNWS